MAHNHLFFMDNFKLFTHGTDSLSKLLSKIKEFFAELELNLNNQQSVCSSDYTEIKTSNGLLLVNKITIYKYSKSF